MLIKIRTAFYINPAHVTNVWVSTAEPKVLRFNLSSDGPGDENVLRSKEEIEAFKLGCNCPIEVES